MRSADRPTVPSPPPLRAEDVEFLLAMGRAAIEQALLASKEAVRLRARAQMQLSRVDWRPADDS
jgi:hypothetical protein